jgi:hypothetical protein
MVDLQALTKLEQVLLEVAFLHDSGMSAGDSPGFSGVRSCIACEIVMLGRIRLTPAFLRQIVETLPIEKGFELVASDGWIP